MFGFRPPPSFADLAIFSFTSFTKKNGGNVKGGSK
jgi:hypothetical protein